MDIKVEILPALQDNYIYAIRYASHALVIDPSDADVVDHFLRKDSLTLEAILITHHHSDHINGLSLLKEKYAPVVYAPQDGVIPHVDTKVQEGDEISVGPLHFQVIHTPGHTKGHVVYFEPQKKILFSGDTLFAGGCGKLFEGTASDMYGSFLKLGALDPNTQVYCGHEYTKTNLLFAQSIEPHNTRIADRLQEIEKKQCTMPFLLRDEFETNPYFRVDDDTLRSALNMSGASSTDVFAEIRHRKDIYHA